MKRWLLWLVLYGALTASAQVPVSFSPFGIVEGFWFPDMTCELGVGWERIIFDWAQHQPQKPDDWNTLNVDDRWIKAASQCNREVVALLKNTPAWATDGQPGPGVPRNLHLPVDDPDNYWAAFVRRTVEYYTSRGVYHYIIWNEPDIDRETYGHEFSGDLEDYFLLLKVAYLSARSVNPAVVIHLAGTTYWHDVNAGRQPYYERLFERIQQDADAENHNHYFDVLSLHLYFRTQAVADILHEMRALLARYKLQKAIWINEMNAAPTIDPDWPVVRPQYPLDLDQQAAFLVQAAALALAYDVERIAVYKLYDQQLPAGGESFGIISPLNATPRPAYAAWRFIAGSWWDVTSASHAQTTTLDAVRLLHATGQETLVVWAREGQPAQVSVDATGSKAYLVDHVGGLQVIYPTDGRYTLALPPARCNASDGCFIGGEPWIVIQPQAGGSLFEETHHQRVEVRFN